MADRKASVALELQAGQFKAEALAVERKIDDLDDAVEELDRDITKIPADAAKAGAALKLLGGDVGSVGAKISSLGEKNTGLAILDAKIRASRNEIRKLGAEFVKTGDVDIFRKLGEAEGKLRGLQDVRKKLSGALVDGVEDAAKVLPKAMAKSGVQAGRETGKTFTAGFQGVLSSPILGPALIAAFAPAILGLSVFLGSALGGAALAGGAAAGAGLGLAGAWMGDPARYQELWDTAIDGIQRRWMDSSAAFGNELEDALKVVDQVLRDLPVERILAISQSFVSPLAGGLGGGITAAADGFADFLAKAQPVVDILGPELANFGHDVGDAFRIMSSGATGGGEALGDLVDVIGFTIRAAALLVLGFELTYGAAKDFANGMSELGGKIPIVSDGLSYLKDKLIDIATTSIGAGQALGDLGATSGITAGSWGGMAKSAAEAAIAASDLNAALNDVRSTTLAMANANLGLAQGWIDLKKELDEGKKTLDTNTQAGINNAGALLSQVQNAEAARQKQLELTGDIAASDAAYAANIERIRQMAYAAGFNRAEVDKLINSIAAIPPSKSTTITTPGLGQALEQGIALGNALNRLRDRTITVTVKQVGDNPMGQSRGGGWATGGIRRAAVGLILPPSNPGTVLAAEPQTGGELLLPLRGISQGRAQGLLQVGANAYGLRVSAGVGGGGGVQTVHHVVDIMGGGELIRRLVITGASNRGQPVDKFLGIG